MTIRRLILPFVILILQASALLAFSPYENFLHTPNPKQVGLVAKLPPENEDSFMTNFTKIAQGSSRECITDSGIRNLTAFTRTIGADTWIVIHFVLDGDRDYHEAAQLFEQASKETRALASMVVPHPRAARFGTKWLQMEWINYIRGKDVSSPASSELMIVTTVLPEKEAEYRALHQAVWPGVVDQVIRSSNRDLCVFLVEIDSLLVEFLYLEYVGTDQQKDDAMSKSDAINHRWWKLTDACQKGLPGVEGNWVVMDQLK